MSIFKTGAQMAWDEELSPEDSVVCINKAGWRWYIIMWDNIINDALRCGLDDEFMLKVKLSDMRELVEALKGSEVEVQRLQDDIVELQEDNEDLMSDGLSANRKLAEHVRESDKELIVLREIAERSGAWKTSDDFWVYGNDEVIYETESGVEVKNTADKVSFQYRHLYRKNHKIKGSE
jgi:hypothetical protein